MSTVKLASNERDGRALDAIESHHAELAGSLELHAQALLGAVGAGEPARIETAREALVDWCRGELVPHAEAEEAVLYPAAERQDDARLLVHAMSREHTIIRELVTRLETGDDTTRLVADTGALRTLFATHVAKENELLLPAVAADPHTSLDDLLEQMHGAVEPANTSHGAHGCGCHDEPTSGLPELDVRDIPHTIRHATVFGALDAVAPGTTLVLVAPHDPVPLLDQIEQRTPGGFDVGYLDRGPEVWRLRLTRRAA